MLTEAEAKAIYDMGKQARAQYGNIRSAICASGLSDWHELKAFDMGYNGIDWVVADYKRFGDLPTGPSYNYLDQRQEKGVSVITDEWTKTIHGMFFIAKNGNRKVVSFRGVFTGYYGGDGEPLVLPVEG